MEGRKLLFVLNPIAGRKGKDEFLYLSGKYCALHNITHINYSTRGDQSDEQAIREVIGTYHPDAVIAVGGDGTVNLVAKLLIHYPVPMGIVPVGSSNGLAKDLGIPEDIIQALDLIRRYKIHSIDALKVNGIYSFHVADLGYNAKVVNRFAKSVVRGKISYTWFGLQELFSYKPFTYTIETEQMVVKGSAFMLTMTNVNRFGNNVNINPLGDHDDGYFEISILKPFTVLSSPLVMYHLLSNSIHNSRFNRVIRCRKAVIKTQNCDSFHIDGEPIAMQDSIDVSIVPRGLRIIVP
jgi:YegS/Rv2252/BmrU family lipid kinase